jgi:predicted transcriptional regulator
MTGKELKEWRSKYGFTQMELSKWLGVTWSAVARWEVEIRPIPPFLHLALEAIENRLMKGGGKVTARTRKTKSKRKEVEKHGKPISEKKQER